MAEIQPINLNPGQFHVPQVDFSWLANLPNTYAQGQQNKFKLDAGNRQQAALAELGKLNPNDPNYAAQVAAIAMRMGDFGAGASLLKTAEDAAGRRSAPTFPAAPAAAPTVAPVATPGTPAPVSPAPTLVPSQTPQVAPGIPALPQGTPGVPSIAPPRTGALLQPQTTQTAPIMAQNATQNLMRGYMAAPDRSNVRLGGVSSELLQHANEVGNSLYGQLNRPLYITSARDSTHTPNSQHYGGNALDLRTRDLNAQQRGAIVAGFRAKGLVAVDEGDHIHVAMPRGAAPVPGAPGAPGTVMASLQGRGPTSGTTVAARPVQTAAIDPANFQTGNPAVASDISPVPMARTAAVGNQAAGGPASVTNPGGAQPSLLPSPTPLQGALPQMAIPQMSLAALGQPGGVGTIGAPPAAPQTASDASPVQMAQAAPYSPPFQTSAPPAAPAPVQRPPVQQAPAVAPQGGPPAAVPGAARGAVDNAPLGHVPKETLLAIAGHRYSTEGNRALAIAELNRRAALVPEQNKPSTHYGDYLKMKEQGGPQSYAEWWEKFGPKPPVTTVNTVEQADTVRAKRMAEFEIDNLKDYKKKSDAAGTTLKTVSALEAAVNMPGFYSGPLSSKVTLVKQIADTLGIPIEEAARLGATTAGANELFSGYSNKLVIDMLGGLGNSVSNTDANRATDVVASLDNTPAGIRMKLAVVKATHKRQQIEYRMALKYYNDHKELGVGFEQEMADFAEKNPLITQEELEKARNGPGESMTIGDVFKKYPRK